MWAPLPAWASPALHLRPQGPVLYFYCFLSVTLIWPFLSCVNESQDRPHVSAGELRRRGRKGETRNGGKSWRNSPSPVARWAIGDSITYVFNVQRSLDGHTC